MEVDSVWFCAWRTGTFLSNKFLYFTGISTVYYARIIPEYIDTSNCYGFEWWWDKNERDPINENPVKSN